MSIFGGYMQFGSQGIPQHLPPLHWPAEACDQWNPGIYLASSFQSESNSKSGTVAFSPKTHMEPNPAKRRFLFATDQFLEFAISSFQVRSWAFKSSTLRPFLHVWWKFTHQTDTERSEPLPLPRYPRTLQKGPNLPKAKTSYLQTSQHSLHPHLHRSQMAILQLLNVKTALIWPKISAMHSAEDLPNSYRNPTVQPEILTGSWSLICCTARTFWPYMPEAFRRSTRSTRHQNWLPKTETLVISKRQATSLGTSGDPQPGEVKR